MTWTQEDDSLVGRVAKATFKIFNRVKYRGESKMEKRSRGEISITMIPLNEAGYMIGKVDSDDEGKRFCEWVARSYNWI